MSSLSAIASVVSTLSSQRPFPGLRPFEEADADWFFGRSSEINELLKRLRRIRFVAIVGPSGCGKSSLIKAGVLPSIRDRYLDASWRLATFRPGEQPLDNLTTAVAAAIAADPQEIRKVLDTGSMGLVKAIQSSRFPSDCNLFLLVDQFEELFEFARRHGDQSQEEVKAFLKLLLTAAASDDVLFYLVITMRMEWLGECATYVGLAEAINQGIYLVPQMSRRQFQQGILNPIDTAGGTITTTLLDRMLNDLGGRSDQLPVLQHALMRLWERRRPGGPMDVTDYESVGTFSNCLSNHAEEIYGELSEEQKKVAETLFRSITQIDKNRKIRRPRPFGELASMSGIEAKQLSKVIEAFGKQGRSFLFTSEGPLDSLSVIDISHEALMRQWARLAKWVEDEAEVQSRLVRLQEDAAAWDARGREDTSALYRGYQRHRAEELRLRLDGSTTALDFLNASRKSERRARYLRRGAIVLSFLFLLLIVAVLALAYQEAKAAAVTARTAETRAKVSQTLADNYANQAFDVQAKLAQAIRNASNSADSKEALASLQKTASQVSIKRVYMQYVGDEALALAKQVGVMLQSQGYVVPGYEKVAPNLSPSKNQVRYFHKEDQPEAEKIASLVGQVVTGDVSAKLTPDPKNVVPVGQFEVWLAQGTSTASQ